MTVELTFDVPPGVNNLFPTVFGKHGKLLRTPSKAYADWRVVAGWQIKTQKPPHITGPVEIDIAFADAGRFDLDAPIKAAVDILVGYGIIEGDNRSVVRKISTYWSDEVKGCRVRISPAE